MYMEHQREITSRMRAILVDWLVDVAEEYHLCAETLFLSVNYLDRYLALAPPVARQELQLVGMACCFIAAYAPRLIAGACADMFLLFPANSRKFIRR
jgi:hypothetical protein